MDLSLFHGVVHVHTWFGKWGYKFYCGSYGVLDQNFDSIIEIISFFEPYIEVIVWFFGSDMGFYECYKNLLHWGHPKKRYGIKFVISHDEGVVELWELSSNLVFFESDNGKRFQEIDGHSKRVLSWYFKPTRPFRIVTSGDDFLHEEINDISSITMFVDYIVLAVLQ